MVEVVNPERRVPRWRHQGSVGKGGAAAVGIGHGCGMRDMAVWRGKATQVRNR